MEMEKIPLAWQLDAITWQLGGIVVVVATAVSLLPAVQNNKERLAIWLFAGATLVTVSADTIAALMMGWTAVIALLFWLLSSLRATYWLLLPLLTLWAAVGWNQWPAWVGGALLVTAVLQMGVWPFSGWRALSNGLPYPLILLLITYLPLTGLAVLSRWPEAAQIGASYGLIITGLGLLGVLMGLWQVWSHLPQPTRAVAGLAQVQMNVALLTAVWGGSEAVLAEARLLLAIAILYLAAGHIQTKWHLTGPIVALAALAGLPLTVGFAARATLYTAWWENGRILLVLVLALMYIPLIMAGLWLIWPQTAAALASGRLLIAWTLPLVGLISLAGLDNTLLPIWLVLLIPFVLGFVATRFATQVDEVRAILRRAFMFSRPSLGQSRYLTAPLAGFGLALREAARVLEGEYGLLWLLAFVVILLLVGGN